MNALGEKHRNFPEKIFIGSLPGDASEEQVRNYFSRFAVVEKVLMFYRTQQTSGTRRLLNKGFCHILVANSVDAGRILNHEHWFLGRTIVCTAFKKGSHLKKNNQHNDNTRAMIKNFPVYVSEFELRNFMSQFGNLRLAYFIARRKKPENLREQRLYQTASVQYWSETSIEKLLASCPIFFDSSELRVEPFVYKQSHKTSGSREARVHRPASFFSKYNPQRFQNKRLPEKVLAEPDHRHPLQMPEDFSGGESVVDDHPLIIYSYVKPTSRKFLHSSVHSNHTPVHNLVYRLISNIQGERGCRFHGMKDVDFSKQAKSGVCAIQQSSS